MKYLISLSLKYIRRQKYRSILTFLCVTLSVFILSTFSVYMSSALTSLKNQTIEDDGSWEINLQEVFESSGDVAQTRETIKNNSAVDSFYYEGTYLVRSVEQENKNAKQLKLSYLNLKINNKENERFKYMHLNVWLGDDDLSSSVFGGSSFSGNNLTGKQAIVPEWFKDEGYDIGDTVTLSFTPVISQLNYDSQQVQAIKEKVKKLNEDNDLEEYLISEFTEENYHGDPAKLNIYSSSLMEYLQDEYGLDEIEFQKEKELEEITFEIEIAGFIQNFDYDIGSIFTMSLSESYENKIAGFVNYFQGHEFFEGTKDFTAYTRINDNVNFDMGARSLLKDLDMNNSDVDDFMYSGENLNNVLLLLEFKATMAIADIVQLIFLALGILAILWFLARFVIDNAFEISAQERSAQFATLRIVGASKAQINTLIMSESIFYCLTAVPLGMFLAFGLCKITFTFLNRSGLGEFEFDINAVITIIGIILCVVAIFISTYTSAIYATRKLSLVESLNYGKPKSKKKLFSKLDKHKKPKKSKLNSNARGFALRYSRKNMLRTKGRYLVSSITLILGTMLFSFMLVLSFAVKVSLDDLSSSLSKDFFIQVDNLQDTEDIENNFNNKNLFKDVEIVKRNHKKYNKDIQENIYNAVSRYYQLDRLEIASIDKHNYDGWLDEATGMSYEDFVKSNSGIVAISDFFADEQILEDCKKNIEEKPEVTFEDGSVLKLSEVVVKENSYTEGGIVFIIPKENESQYFDKQTFYSLSITANVASADKYTDAKNMLEELTEQERCQFEDLFEEGTGLKNTIIAVSFIALTLILAVWLTGILSMTNSINTSILLRERELLMLRALGMSKKQLYGIVISESVIITLISSVIGTAVGVFAGRLIILDSFDISILNSSIWIALVSIVTIGLNLIISYLTSLPSVATIKKKL